MKHNSLTFIWAKLCKRPEMNSEPAHFLILWTIQLLCSHSGGEGVPQNENKSEWGGGGGVLA